MGSKLVKKLRFITVDNFEKEEAFFHDMSADGLHFEMYKFPFYYFKREKNVKYQYQTDFQSLKEEDKESYLQLFQDAGWELVFEYPGVYGSWFYFRKPMTNEPSPNIFTDVTSKIELYRKIRKNWAVFLLAFTPVILLVMMTFSWNTSIGNWRWITVGLWVFVALLYAKITINLTIKINKLASSNK